MQYFLIEISKTLNGQVAKAIWEKETLDLALMQLHQTLASAMANENVDYILVQIIDGRGANYRSEFYQRQVESTEG